MTGAESVKWILFGWILGYLAGANSAHDGPDFLIKTDAGALFPWFEDHCRANPLETIDKASDALIKELVDKNGEKWP